MSMFDDREKEFEARFKHDQEFRFKVTVRRNRMLGIWAAERLGLLGDAAEAYVKHVVDAQFQPGGDTYVVDKVTADLNAKDPTITAARIRFELDPLAEHAKRQLMKE